MPNTINKPSKLDTLKRAFVQLETSQAKLKAFESEPIAILGMGCRFPGNANDAESFWDLMINGRDAVAEVPPERWDVDAYYDPDPEEIKRMKSMMDGAGPFSAFYALNDRLLKAGISIMLSQG